MLGEGARSADDAETISTPMRLRSRPSAPAPATPPGRRDRASRSSFRRCIRASRRSRASGCSRNCRRASLELARMARGARTAIHHRRRGSRPARTVARSHRRGARRSFVARMGRIWPCRAGVSEARAGGRSTGSRKRRGVRRPAHGAAGQRRLLGHRDQARAGARPGRLSGIHPQGHDRPLLHGLRAQASLRRAHIFPQFATHNALTVASIIEDAGGVEGYEFQRLHGMGETLYATLLAELPDTACRVYAPVGGHRDLLAYLVRRLLENGANSSFVSVAADPSVPIDDILRRPQSVDREPSRGAQQKNPAAARSLSAGTAEFVPASNSAIAQVSTRLLAEMRAGDADRARPRRSSTASALVGIERAVHLADRRPHRSARSARPTRPSRAPRWRRRTPALPPGRRRQRGARRRARSRRRHAWKPIAAACWRCCKTKAARHSTTRCRKCARRPIIAAITRRRRAPRWRRNDCPGRPAKATSCAIAAAASSSASARGIFRWRFFSARSPRRSPPAMRWWRSRRSRRRSIAARAVALLHRGRRAGDRAASRARRRRNRRQPRRRSAHAPASASPARPRSARAINRALAAKNAPIVPLIAETGGINAMIVDATALPEQVIDDVITSAFRSAGQRCSALRLLCLQDDIAEPMLDDADRRRCAN